MEVETENVERTTASDSDQRGGWGLHVPCEKERASLDHGYSVTSRRCGRSCATQDSRSWPVYYGSIHIIHIRTLCNFDKRKT